MAASIVAKAIGVACLAGAPALASPTRALRYQPMPKCAPGEYKAQYEQCGGKHYAGCDKCADGLACVGRPDDGEQYKQCQQTMPLQQGQQCGGSYWQGPTLCADGLVCQWDSAYYSHCAVPAWAAGSTGWATPQPPQPQPYMVTGAYGQDEPAMAPAGYSSDAENPVDTEAVPEDLAPVAAGRRLASAAAAAPSDAAAAAPATLLSPADLNGAPDGVIGIPQGELPPGSEAQPLAYASHGSYSQLYEQCGGEHYSGPLQCAEGLVCKKFSMWYSQCLRPHGAVRHYQQCGGKHYYGPTNCDVGTACVKLNEYYSQCLRPQVG